MTKATLGSISSETLRTEDLLPACLDTLNALIEDATVYKDLRSNAVAWCNQYGANPDMIPDQAAEDGSEIVNELVDALNEYAPAYAYFGAHEGDGADFGFWPRIDALEETARYKPNEVLKLNAGDEPSYIMSVSDHGNVTLYRVTLEEEWSCV